VTASQIVTAAPWRTARSARGQEHYPGYYWSATTGGHVIYESRLELARLLLADFAPDVVAIAAQPFLLRAQAGGRARRHVPDFLLLHAGQTVRVVNVKPAARLADPAIAEALAWPGELFEARGWGHEIWTGAEPVFLANVRFLAGYRRPGMPPDAVTDATRDEIRPGECLGGLLDRLEGAWPRPLATRTLNSASTGSSPSPGNQASTTRPASSASGTPSWPARSASSKPSPAPRSCAPTQRGQSA
jgi:hypothetical protein